MRVGAVVLHYRLWPGIVDTLEALLTQTRPPDAVVVVDNHSNDGSAALIRETFPEVEVIELERNGGYAAGMNRGIAELRRRDVDAILLLTHECHLAPDTLEALVDRLAEAPRVGAVGPLLGFLSDPNRVFSAGGEIESTSGGTTHRQHPKLLKEWAETPPLRAQVLDGAALLLRSAAVREVGKMDERYFMYFEETELLLKMQRLGWSVECVPRAVGWQEPGRRPRVLWDRNRFRFLARNGRKKTLAREIARSIHYVARILLFSESRQDRDRARALARALRLFLTRRWGPVSE